jgi:hypothetical protein
VIRAGDPSEPARLRAGDVLEHAFTLDQSGEAWTALTLSAPGTCWLRAEPAVVALTVDGRHPQEIILAAGADPTRYERFLGSLVPGTHRLRLELHKGLSAPGAQEVAVADIHTGYVKDTDPAALVWRHVPVIHYRALSSPCDSLTTDTPLVLFHRSRRAGRTTSVEYHVIFSHEDAGTDLTGLLAEWGHTVDIEWVFRVTVDDEGRVIAEEYQGLAHATFAYGGGRAMGGHPVLQVATLNGTVTDRPACPYRTALAPVCAQPDGEPREGVLQQFPWIYRVSALEVLRQVPLEAPPSPESPAPADLRSYLFLQWKRVGGPAVPIEARARVGYTWHGSAWGRVALAFQEADAESTAIKMPAGTTEADVTGLAIRVLAPPPQPLEVALVRAFFLDAAYLPRPSFIPSGVWRLHGGQRERVVWDHPSDEVS